MSGTNSIAFNGDSPVMSGTWINRRTGDSFTVRDSFFEDGQYVVTTTDNRRLNYGQLMDYEQTDPKSLAEFKAEQSSIKKDSSKSSLPKEVADMLASEDSAGHVNEDIILPDDLALISGSPIAPPPAAEKPAGNIYKEADPISSNYMIIDKALKKTDLPEVRCEMKWTSYPSREIEMLKDVMDIPADEIADYYISKLDLHEIKRSLEEAIRKTLSPPAPEKEDMKERMARVRAAKKNKKD